MRRRLLAAFAMVVVLASACGGQDDETADDPVPDDVDSNADVTVPDDDSAATATTTTVTIPPEATEIPDLQIVFVEFGEVGYVVIANQSDEAVDLSGIQLCQFATCADLGTVVDGGSIPAVESAEIPAATIGGLRSMAVRLHCSVAPISLTRKPSSPTSNGALAVRTARPLRRPASGHRVRASSRTQRSTQSNCSAIRPTPRVGVDQLKRVDAGMRPPAPSVIMIWSSPMTLGCSWPMAWDSESRSFRSERM